MPKPKVDTKYNEMLIKIGLNVAYYRNLRNLTQLELSEKTDLSRNTIGRIEAPDKYYGMALNSLFRISEALNISPNKLFDFRDEHD